MDGRTDGRTDGWMDGLTDWDEKGGEEMVLSSPPWITWETVFSSLSFPWQESWVMEMKYSRQMTDGVREKDRPSHCIISMRKEGKLKDNWKRIKLTDKRDERKTLFHHQHLPLFFDWIVEGSHVSVTFSVLRLSLYSKCEIWLLRDGMRWILKEKEKKTFNPVKVSINHSLTWWFILQTADCNLFLSWKYALFYVTFADYF